MKRFVTYLYEYDRTIRGRNVGFIRNDTRNDCCRMEIHIRGLDRIKEKAPIYIIVRDNGCIGIPAGEIIISQGVGNACLNLNSNQIGKTQYPFKRMQAVIIHYGNGKMLMGCYVQHPAEDLLSGNFMVWKSEETLSANTVDTHANDLTATHDENPKDYSSQEKNANSSGEPLPQKESTDYAGDSDEMASAETVTDQSEELTAMKDNASFAPTTYKRIAITDIRTLPSRNWHLCNNSFLVHGFFCYHYLILKTENAPAGAKMYIGVPGIYAQQERMMALLFGFNDFEPAQNSPDEEDYTNEIFGYWLCPLEA